MRVHQPCEGSISSDARQRQCDSGVDIAMSVVRVLDNACLLCEGCQMRSILHAEQIGVV